MTFWKTVGAVIVGNIIAGLLGLLVFTMGLAGLMGGDHASDLTTVDVPDKIDVDVL